jgi:hypothetical protein
MAFWLVILITVFANLITVFANDSDHHFCKSDHRFCKSVTDLYLFNFKLIKLPGKEKRGRHRAAFPRIGGHSM